MKQDNQNMKKIYIAPSLTVIELDETSIICTSEFDVPIGGNGGGRPAGANNMRNNDWSDYERY